MKKALMAMTVILMLGLYSTLALGSTTFNLSFDSAGKHKIESNDATDTKAAASLEAEYTVTDGPSEYGVGIGYQSPREIEELAGEFSFIPVYLTGKYSFQTDSANVNPYIVGRLGYNFFSGDSDYEGTNDLGNGFYCALGFGVTLTQAGDGKSSIAALYEVNNGTLDASGSEQTVKYSKAKLVYSYKFD
ncbi:hypothetical protein EDC14_100255 [Hydrogenispora ethanolica]|uniref:Outer membrane protein with beta-barrel domain n=1 Tax=Hydrogenispora ethanolica TaxID=1082276 RepID=A0A4R1SCH7_HYDET|nr:hypothetical protein [Hydrogenispora ethanolica]TCL76302.1 hypothetical protein EDC14_100255 [Hydrogenispora ethanolica]